MRCETRKTKMPDTKTTYADGVEYYENERQTLIQFRCNKIGYEDNRRASRRWGQRTIRRQRNSLNAQFDKNVLAAKLFH